MRGCALVLLLGSLAGCGGGGTPTPVASSTPNGPSEFQSRVAALAPGERNAVFIRAIRDAGKDCQGVTESQRRNDAAGGEPLYVAKCTDGASYGVLLGRDGTAQVVGAPAS